MVNNLSSVNSDFWYQKKIFLTGHTGFKGGWLTMWLQQMGAIVKGFSLKPPPGNPSLFIEANIGQEIISEIGDIRDRNLLHKSLTSFNPDILIHLAAQPLVRLSYLNPVETFETNVMGTANVLDSSRSCDNLKAILVITTDKCYENREWVWGYRESDPMGGFDPYSSSKGAAELLVSSFRQSFFIDCDNPIALASARAGNVIGGGDWSEDRLIPDALSSINEDIPLKVRNPKSIRPWQHVLEPLSGYLKLSECLYDNGQEYAEAWNFGPKDEDCKSVESVLNKLYSLWEGNVKEWEYEKSKGSHEAGVLKLDCSKALSRMNWSQRWNLDMALKKTVDWYKKWIEKENVRVESIKQITEFNR